MLSALLAYIFVKRHFLILIVDISANSIITGFAITQALAVNWKYTINLGSAPDSITPFGLL